MKHSYDAACTCPRCTKERARRNSQGRAQIAQQAWPAVRYRGRQRTQTDRRPVHGSQEWAETRGDDLGESPDY